MGDADRADPGAAAAPHAAGAATTPAAEAGELVLAELLPLAIPEAARRGPGRPAGARNIRTEQTARVIVARYGDPLIASAAIGNMPLDQLVTFIRKVASDCGLVVGKGVGVFDLLRFQAECRRDVMPFIHAKRAPVDEEGEVRLPMLGIVAPGGSYATGGVDRGASIEDAIDVVANQGVTTDDEAKSHDEKSHDDATD